MYTIQQIAAEIELTKPDLTEFLNLLLVARDVDILRNIQDTLDIPIKLLKAEITLILFCTNQQKSSWGMSKDLGVIITKDLSKHGLSITTSYTNTSNYCITEEFDPTCHILAHITEPRPYLPKYLWDKIRTKRKLQAIPLKQLQPNHMSLVIFQTHLKNTKKSMSSVEAINYLTQINSNNFGLIRQDFMAVIFDKCTKPSLDLQRQLSESYRGQISRLPNQNDIGVSRYMYLSKSSIRSLASELNIPVLSCIYDTRDSEYKPFITNMYRIADGTNNEVSYLFSALIVLQSSIEITPNPVYSYFIEHITKHLQNPELVVLVDNLRQRYLLTNTAFTKLTL